MVQVDVTPEVICLAIAVTTGAANPSAAATRAIAERNVPERTTDELADRFRSWLADPSPAAAAAIRDRVEQGAPPAALLVLLEGLRAAPRTELVGVVESLAAYRRADVRAAAIAAWAEHDGQAERAIAQAAGDLDPAVRRLVPALGARHPSDVAEQLVVDLLAQDAALAAALAQDEPELVIEDEPEVAQ